MKGYKNRGVTLLELLITLAILLVITSAIFSFFISSNKSMNTVEESNIIQNEGEIAINKFSETALNSSTIKTINAKNFNEILEADINIFSMNLTNNYTSMVTQYKVENGKLYYKTSDKTNWELISNYVHSLVISPIKDSVGKAYGMKMTLTLKYKNGMKTFNNQIYFRNN